MKPKPLKNKVLLFKGAIINKKFVSTSNTETPLYHAENVKSAVEWLKQQLKKENYIFSSNELNDLIDKAFEDVTKNNKED